ncbi:MAG: hypothetical protein M3Y75_10185 [Actinomycetota bacterium]|nr:hypothetical protein [Actinomycetota bacterium]
MAVMAREAWTDERLGDLAKQMDKGFDEVKGEIRDVKGEVGELRKDMNSRFTGTEGRFTSIEGRFNSIEGRFNSIDARFDSLQRTMVLGVISMSATIVGALLVIQL